MANVFIDGLEEYATHGLRYHSLAIGVFPSDYPLTGKEMAFGPMLTMKTESNTSSLRVEQRPSHIRWGVLVLLFLAVGINYMDRVNLSVVQGNLEHQYALTGTQYGWLQSTFIIAYLIAQVPGGRLLDRWGTEGFYALLILLWSGATFAMGIGGGLGLGATAVLGLMLICRTLIGLAQAPSFPANAKIAAMWFPHHERARAIGAYSTGQYLVTGLMVPILGIVGVHYGWPAVFYVSGGLGILLGLWWLIGYRDPAHSHANAEELALIQQDARQAPSVANEPDTGKVGWPELRHILRQGRFWGICFMHFSATSILYFFLTWFVPFLRSNLQLQGPWAGVMESLPFILAAVGVLLGSTWSDLLLKKGSSLVKARKIPIVSGLVVSALIFFCPLLSAWPMIVICVLSIVFLANAGSNLGWTAMSDILPKRMIGTAGGILNICGNMAGILTPLIFGWVRDVTGRLDGGMYYLGAIALLGALCFLFFINDLTEIDIGQVSSR